MKRLFCDRCRKETGRLYTISFPWHLVEEGRGARLEPETQEPIPGGMVEKEMCLRCYNAVFGAAFKVFEDVPALGVVEDVTAK